LQHSIQFLSKIGLSEIEEKIKELSTYAKHNFTDLGVLDKVAKQRNDNSAIFNIKGDQKLHNTLKEKNIITSLRRNGIRISLHFYNNKEDIDKLVGILHRYR